MHKFLSAIGFSNIRKKDLEIVLKEIIEHPQVMRITKDSQGNEFAELSKYYGNGIGILLRGFYDENDSFNINYYVPFVVPDEITTQEQIDIEKHAEKESYAGICDEVRLGVTLIFYLQNVADFLSEYRDNIHTKDLKGASLSALSVEGKILLPIQQKVLEKQAASNKHESRQKLIAKAREGNEEAIENLSIQDLDMYSQISKRIKKEDVFSIVSTYFMPYGIESDQYSILGEILDVELIKNSITGENVYTMDIECNDLHFKVTINEKDILGEPAIGRRFKGNIWMQGEVCI